jgi:single-stranded-DNA-specific exonuclease
MGAGRHLSDVISNTASGIPWEMRLSHERDAIAMAQQHQIDITLARILAGRGVTLDQVPDILNPTLKHALPDPFHLRDMDTAIARLAAAIQAGETIAVFGDYDVDGATASAQWVRYLAALNVPCITHIPDRLLEGYGPNIPAFDALIDRGAQLVITVDCGTLAFAPIAHAKARGTDVIVIDHHLGEAQLPEAHAIINPNRADETSEHRNLCAAGVTFLVLVALNKALREAGFFAQHHLPEPNLISMLDLVALGTVCDVMPLTGLNRSYVAQGLKVMAQRRNIGLRALADIARLDDVPNVYHLGFLLGPRINAGGRVGKASMGLELLTTDSDTESAQKAAALDQFNAERQAIERSVLEQAMLQAEAQHNAPVIVAASEGWHPGVIGIVAGRIKEQFSRPCAVISIEGGSGKGSARSVPGADMGAAIHQALHAGILSAGGGHSMAAGFSLDAENISAFQLFLSQKLEAAVAAYDANRTRKLDGWLRAASATPELLHAIAQAGPYGMGFPSPRFGLKHVEMRYRKVLKDAHIKCVVGDAGGKARLNAMAFNAVGTRLGDMLEKAQVITLAGELKWNRWQGTATPQFIIDDAAMQESQ